MSTEKIAVPTGVNLEKNPLTVPLGIVGSDYKSID